MKHTVEINRSQYDARPVIVLPYSGDPWAGDFHPIGSEVHIFTDAELRARDERIALAALRRAGLFQVSQPTPLAFDAIIAAAEADR